MPNNNQHEFVVRGMHCNSCVLLIEDKVGSADGVQKAKVNLKDSRLSVEANCDREQLRSCLNALIEPHGYSLIDAAESTAGERHWRELAVAVPLALALIGLFVLLEKLKVFNFALNGEMNYGLAFAIGLTASVSTCLAVVGGLALSVAANQARTGARWTAAAMFHVGRLGGFFLLGGLVGWLGQSLHLGTVGTLILNLAVAIVMLILGLNLLEMFPALRRLELHLPRFMGRGTVRAGNVSNRWAPLLVGIGTFFLPCGFTQAMQFQALNSGDFWRGGLLMLTFALGTLPVLSALSFGAFTVRNLKWRGVFFKTAGTIVIVLSLLGIWNALAGAGIVMPLSF